MPRSQTLKSFTETWLQTFKQDTIKESSYDALCRQFDVMSGFPIANMDIQDITSIDIQQYISQLTQKGYALTTIKKLARIATAPLKKAAALRIIPSDPSVDIRFPSPQKVKKPPRQSAAYTEDELVLLNRQLDVGKRVGYAAITLMLEEGLRVGEALALDWGDVDLENRKLHIHKTVIRLADRKQSKVVEGAKTFSSNRTIPLTPRAVMLLKKCKQGYEPRADDPVFLGNDGERLTYEALRYQTQMLCKDAGVKYRGEHAFRHTFATNCFRRGINVKILSRLLGHSSVQITYDTYIHLYGDGFDDMREALCGEL
jgi:integrase